DKDNAKRLKEKRKRLADERSSLLSPTINLNLNF
ncbi:DNA repair protein, partial [Vibrio parahaemolyticus]|nr:DNA repair protein [Vibrio parahaemolyticus]